MEADIKLNFAGVIKVTLKSFCDLNIGLARNILVGLAQPHRAVAAVLCISLHLLIKEEYQQSKSTIYGGVRIYMPKRVWYRFNVDHAEL